MGLVLLVTVLALTRPLDGPRDTAGAASSPRAVVWAVGDGATGGAKAKALARRIRNDDPNRFLYLGDVYEHGTWEDFQDNYRTVYGALDSRTLPTPGNHEWANRVTGYDAYWRARRGRRQPHRYATRIAGWQVISLNSEASYDSDSNQLRWLRERVRGDRTCRLAFWHRPRYSASTGGDERDVEPFWDVLEGRTRIVLNGHAHNSQRFPRYRGIVQFIAGAGGRELHRIDDDDRRPAFADDRHFAALRLVLRPGSASYRFVGLGGRTLHRGTVSCRS